MNSQTIFNFVCQRCQKHVHLDKRLSHFSEITSTEFSSPIHAETEVDFMGHKLEKATNPFQFHDSNAQIHGFTVLRDPLDSSKLSPENFSTKLLNILTSNRDTDNIMCEECTDSMIEDIDSYINRIKEQISLYEKLYSSKQDLIQEDIAELEEEHRMLLEEETRLLKELTEVEKERTASETVLGKLKEENERLEKIETHDWREFCSNIRQVIVMEDENQSVKRRMSDMKQKLARLKQMNEFKATFHIWYTSGFGTINTMCLGRLPDKPVPWPEINAAWGQIVLLLTSLAKKIGLKFSKYKLVPHGNTSFVQVIDENNKELPLYGLPKSRYLKDHKFDLGMEAFLECMAEFQQHIESRGFQESRDATNKFCLPYRVNKHHMEDASGVLYSIKSQFNGDKQWTKALKLLLINLKWALTWVSSPKKVTSKTSSSKSLNDNVMSIS